MLARLEALCRNLCQKWDVDLMQFGGENDHIHLLIAAHPILMPSRFVNNLKSVTSRLLRKEFSSHLKRYYWKPVLWSRAYCLISAGGAALETLKDYIRKQEAPRT